MAMMFVIAWMSRRDEKRNWAGPCHVVCYMSHGENKNFLGFIVVGFSRNQWLVLTKKVFHRLSLSLPLHVCVMLWNVVVISTKHIPLTATCVQNILFGFCASILLSEPAIHPRRVWGRERGTGTERRQKLYRNHQTKIITDSIQMCCLSLFLFHL